MNNIFSELKNMSQQLSNALSTVFQLLLIEFLHFDTYALESVEKPVFCRIPINLSGFLTPNVDFIRRIETVEASYRDI